MFRGGAHVQSIALNATCVFEDSGSLRQELAVDLQHGQGLGRGRVVLLKIIKRNLRSENNIGRAKMAECIASYGGDRESVSRLETRRVGARQKGRERNERRSFAHRNEITGMFRPP
eukprot:GHVU01210717.1.p1 GENE.GHVU01210717.1~~GHVU01210717.1.p1  ORF type:complete len:116 (-),score=2.13 GHVU01210717.1:971-1318(-)